ncbi:6,7-dimethyl-8-ribityllumazine synthase [Pyrobaculum neutrophilum]|uniref:6,7-dimethyl-8-ribityllumazine synthase n=1 Tax=Pyrobaculum neutrophilum (strain DSM 2338 / JCM 9278 / NBRC 100436 / V24Sta) TaxID=444157 RepID=RISB_PYRNV|nr:6,7-dimethyl-8-ribityllumazine synthase [Pyrobaculum neutrophilum]B1Y9N5.1 RecName: Full=6,7-dimethyl-8-ribityllumazine synthase; Short=DMRL synthase; Short=LS; Short=Lumazine synthase [Pyrobaculum neutrophilum V24Sta]ACB40464.1 6,7-dimethyl-8-ribityllumazine synthase [Pyrobaculum neutrophilum V24Sta]
MVRLALVVAEFNYDITSLMLQKAIEHARFLGAEVTYVVKVPGVYDIPMVLKDVVAKSDVDAVATLGAVIQGATKHDELVAQQAARKILDIAVEVDKPITLGIIGHGANRMQALERVEEYARRAVEAAVKLARRKKLLKDAKYSGATVYVE